LVTKPAPAAGRREARSVVRTGALVSVAAAGVGLLVTSAMLRVLGVRSGVLGVVLLIAGTLAVATATGLAAGYVFGRRETARSTIIE
jgi:hypothetical protein